MMRYTISSLVDKVNSLNVEGDINLNSESLVKSDARIKVLTERRVRDYQTKKLISEPIKDGRNSFYTEEHVKQLVNLREMQKQGMSDSFMQKVVQESYYQPSSSNNDDTKDMNYFRGNVLIGASMPLNNLNSNPDNSLQSNLLNTLNNIVASSSTEEAGSPVSKASSQALTTNLMKEIGSQYLSSSSLQKFKYETKQHYQLTQYMTIIIDKDKKLNEIEKNDLIKRFNEFIENI